QTIDVRGPPKVAPIRRRTPQDIEFMREEVSRLKAHNIVEPSKSPWRSEVVLVRRNGKTRMAVDFRAVNDATVFDAYPMPNLEEELEAVSGLDWYSTFDLVKGYHQVPLEESSAAATAFNGA